LTTLKKRTDTDICDYRITPCLLQLCGDLLRGEVIHGTEGLKSELKKFQKAFGQRKRGGVAPDGSERKACEI